MQSLADAERLGVADALEQQQYKDGDIIIKEGDAGNTFTSLKKVPSSVQQPSTGSEPVELCVLKVGDYFGEIALMTNRPRAASVVAIGAVNVLCIRRKNIHARAWANHANFEEKYRSVHQIHCTEHITARLNNTYI